MSTLSSEPHKTPHSEPRARSFPGLNVLACVVVGFVAAFATGWPSAATLPGPPATPNTSLPGDVPTAAEGQAPVTDPAVATFAIRSVRLFDGRDTSDDVDVVVRDGRVVAIGHALPLPAGIARVEGRGRTLLPGLIDAHVHSWGTSRRDALRFGVTTELDMFTDWHGLADARVRRDAMTRTTEADLWSAGTLATAPRGHGTEYGLPIATLTTPGEAAAFVDARLAEGSDYLKIILDDGSAFGHGGAKLAMPTLDTPTLAALVAAAHAKGRLAVAHVSTQADAARAIASGVDGLAHVFMDTPADDALVAAAVAARVFVVPTLSVVATAAGAGEGAKLAADPRIGLFLEPAQAGTLAAAFPSGWSDPGFLPNALASVRRLRDAGVPLLAGTDAGNPGTTHGASLHGELALLVRAGLTPLEALRAATSTPAARFALPDRGRIAVGTRADLVLVDGDPDRDITATRAIVAVWKNGYVVDRRPAPPPASTAAPLADEPRVTIADFDDGGTGARFGAGWTITTDRLIQGRSVATQRWSDGGADGSKGALAVDGTIAPGLPFAWAGTMWLPAGTPQRSADWSKRATLVFQARGDGRVDSAMLFSGAPENGRPSIVTFETGAGWREVRIRLDRFVGADLQRVRGLAFTAGVPVGDFHFEIDEVGLE